MRAADHPASRAGQPGNATANIIDPAGTLKLLSSMYLCKPSAQAIAGWSALLADDPPAHLGQLKQALASIDPASEQTMEDLLWDYTRLFIGPYKLPCPPWESVYTSQKKLMMQDAADEVRGAYAGLGLALDDAGVMPDHIGAELNFLALACERMAGRPGSSSDCARIGAAFLNDHLLNWVPQFSADMEIAAETPLYKALAKTTRSALDLLNTRA
jgi:TorA maturation chaperone TorD